MLYLRRGSLLLDGGVSGLRLVLGAAGEDDEVGAVLFQAGNVGRERLLLPDDTFLNRRPRIIKEALLPSLFRLE